MLNFNEENIKIINGVKYIDIVELERVLNIPELARAAKSKARKLVCEEFSIRIFREKEVSKNQWDYDFFNLDDVQRAVDEINAFYSSYYLKEELLKKVNIIHIAKFSKNSIKVPDKFRYTGENAITVYDKEPCDAIIENILNTVSDKPREIEFEGEIYLNIEITLSELGVISNPIPALAYLEKDLNFKVIKHGSKGHNRYFNLNDIENLKKEINTFYDTHYLRRDVEKLLPPSAISELNSIPLETKHIIFLADRRNNSASNIAYNKEDVDNLINLYREGLTSKEVCEALNINERYLKRFREEYNLRTTFNYNSGSGDLYIKEDIDALIKKKEEFYSIYITRVEAEKSFNTDVRIDKTIARLDKYPVPLYAKDRTYFGGANCREASFCVYKRSDIDKAREEYFKNRHKRELSDIFADSAYNTYIERLSAYQEWEGFDEKSVYTSKKWFDYVKGYLTRTRSKGKTLNGKINTCISATIELKAFFLDLSHKKEVYAITTAEVNMGLKVITTLSICRFIYNFFKEVSVDLISTKKVVGNAFSFDRLTDPSVIWNNVGESEYVDEIYSFEEYSEVFNYCTDTDIHIKKSLAEIKKCNYEYTSTWLYVMLHLNNAWRNGDVNSFPYLEISDLLNEYNINSVDWFEENRVSLALGRAVIFRINEWEFTISKTQIKGAFFCSDELLPAFVTAVILLTLVNNSCGIKQDTLLRIDNKYNEVKPPQLKSFFKEIELDNFIFGSKKFNKTVMTYIYYIANLSGDSKALIYAMKLRGHIDANMPAKHYIKFDIKQIEGLSRKLFARGEFGFIPSLLVQRLNGGKLSFDEITNEVEALNNSFGDIVKINASVGFINSLRLEREEIVNAISDMSLEQLQTKATEIFARKLPSKDSTNVQCLFGDSECKRTELESCFECPYHIPSIYALTAICDSIKSDLIKYHNTNLMAVKFRLVQSINKKKIDIKAAINKYGLDYVYNCLGIERDDFKRLLASVPKPEKLISLITSDNNSNAKEIG